MLSQGGVSFASEWRLFPHQSLPAPVFHSFTDDLCIFFKTWTRCIQISCTSLSVPFFVIQYLLFPDEYEQQLSSAPPVAAKFIAPQLDTEEWPYVLVDSQQIGMNPVGYT